MVTEELLSFYSVVVAAKEGDFGRKRFTSMTADELYQLLGYL